MSFAHISSSRVASLNLVSDNLAFIKGHYDSRQNAISELRILKQNLLMKDIGYCSVLKHFIAKRGRVGVCSSEQKGITDLQASEIFVIMK